ncbi:hypothetical protein MaudCBS49596_003554 [Microsporum audouinii]
MGSRHGKDLMSDGKRKQQDRRQGASQHVTLQTTTTPTTKRKRIVETEELSQRSVNCVAKRQRANLSDGHRDGQQGNSDFLGRQDFDLKASTRDSSTTSKKSLQHERVSEDPAPLKHYRTEKDPYVEYWVAHKYQISKEPIATNPMEYWFARPKALRQTKSSTSLYTQSESGSNKNRYDDKNFEIFLQSKGSFMEDDEDGISGDSKELCQLLLEKGHIVPPRDTVFDQVAFKSTCRRVETQSEMGVIRIIGELIVPSAECAIGLGHVAFKHLISKVNEVWDNSISLNAVQPPLQLPLHPPPPPQALPKYSQFQLSRPQPDFAVGFCRRAFSDDQLRRLEPFIGDVDQSSFFMSTADTYFPFMTSEVKCRKAALDIADRQNAHSMTLAVRGVVELFRVVKRLKELNREILGFSISHDHCSVRIYGHYPIIDGEKVTYYRHTIHKFDFTSLEGRERWTSYNFTLNVYDRWAPSHFNRLCSAIDDIPDVTFDVSHQSGALERSEELQPPEVSNLGFSEATGISQGLEDVGLGSSFTSLGENDGQGSDPKPGQMKNKRKRVISESK